MFGRQVAKAWLIFDDNAADDQQNNLQQYFHYFTIMIILQNNYCCSVQLQLTCEAFALPVPDNIVSDFQIWV